MTHIEPDQFLLEVTRFYKKTRSENPKAVTLTIKPYNGSTKPKPRPKKQPKSPPKTEILCLVRAKLGKKHISTYIQSKEVNRFHISFMGTLKEHMDNLKRREKEKKSISGATKPKRMAKKTN